LEDVKKYFPVEIGFLGALFGSKEVVHAVDGVSFSIETGHTLSLVGETGSGKTTIGLMAARLLTPTSGRIIFDGRDLSSLSKEDARKIRRDIQMIFQDPYASLNPRKSIEEIVGLPLEVHGIAEGAEKRRKVIELLEDVGLSPGEQYVDRYPHEFSGGQRQRIGIARALALKPKFIVADEPVSALDVSVRSQILNLMQDLKEELHLTYLLIAHDLSVVRYMSDKLVILYLGRVMEYADSEEIFMTPLHPYTKALLAAVPIPDPDAHRLPIRLAGEMPSPIRPPSGCRFHTRCPSAMHKCATEQPQLVDTGGGHFVACHLVSRK
jgi:oligopeptide/dipeptide ABC transporter ATP-binding protein